MTTKINKLLCANSKWHRNERLATICSWFIHAITLAVLALLSFLLLKNQTISNRILLSLLAVEIAFYFSYILSLKRASKAREEFYDITGELIDCIEETQCEQSCEKW